MDYCSYFQNRFDKQQLIQATITLDLARTLREEIGFFYHRSNGGLPGGTNRTTIDQIQKDTDSSGSFSYHFDGNRAGQIMEREMRNSYCWGTPQLERARSSAVFHIGGENDTRVFFTRGVHQSLHGRLGSYARNLR